MGFGYSFLVGIAAAISCAFLLVVVGFALRSFQRKGVEPITFMVVGAIMAGGEGVFLYSVWALRWAGLVPFGLIALVAIFVLADIFSSTPPG